MTFLTVRFWDVADSRELRRFVGRSGWGIYVAYAPDGRRLVSGSSDKTVRLSDVATAREFRRFEDQADEVLSVALAPFPS